MRLAFMADVSLRKIILENGEEYKGFSFGSGD